MKKYHEILVEVKEKTPEMSHRDAQKTASVIFREQEEVKAKAAAKDKPESPAPGIDVALSKIMEEEIYGENHLYDKNKILIVARAHGDFDLIKAGKDGVNTLVYLSGPTRVPATGYFKIYI